MQVGALATAFSIGLVFNPGATFAASPEDIVDAFRIGCLDQLPDFRGSMNAFRKHGFVSGQKYLQLDTPEGKILASVMRPQSDGTSGCVIIAQPSPDIGIGHLIADAIAETTDNRFRRERGAVDGAQQESFTWRSGEAEIAVTLTAPSTNGVSVLLIISGKATE